MNVDLDRLMGRATGFAAGGAVAIIVGWIILSKTFGDASRGLTTGDPSMVGLLFGWGLVAVGAMAIQAGVVAWLFAGAGAGPRAGDEGVVMRDD